MDETVDVSGEKQRFFHRKSFQQKNTQGNTQGCTQRMKKSVQETANRLQPADDHRARVHPKRLSADAESYKPLLFSSSLIS